MKTKDKLRMVAYILMVISVFTLSCKKKEIATDNSAPLAKGSLMLHIHTNVDENEVGDYDSVYVMTDGRKISLGLAQLYISNIQLIKADGSTFDLTGINILKTMESEKYSLTDIPSGNYRSIRFNVGLAPNMNNTMPSMGDSILNCSAMWFDKTQPSSGHAFINLQGKIDTSAGATNSMLQMQAFAYKIGTSAHLKSVSMPNMNYAILPNQTQLLHIIIDYNKLFSGISLNTNANLHVDNLTANSSALADKIADNIPLMFRYE